MRKKNHKMSAVDVDRPRPLTTAEHQSLISANGFDLFACAEQHLHIFTTADGKRLTEHAMTPEEGYDLAAAIVAACDEIIGA